jgi:hypothetical protein
MAEGGGVAKRPWPVERERILATTPANMRAYHRSLKRLFDVHQYDSSLVGAFDETMLDYSDEGKAALFVYTFGQSPAAVPGSASSAHITLGATIFADGSAMRPMVILPLSQFPQGIEHDMISQFCGWAGQEAGWMNKPIFADYIRNHVMPEYKRRGACAERRGLFVVDGHSSREQPELWTECREKWYVDVHSVVSHSTAVAMPLDVSVFPVFKRSLRGARTALKKMTRPEQRQKLLERALHAYRASTSYSIVKAGFRDAGLFPLSLDALLGNPIVGPVPKMLQVTSNKKRDRPSISNRVLSSAEYAKEVADYDAQQAAKKKKKTPAKRKQSTQKTPENTSSSSADAPEPQSKKQRRSQRRQS